MLPPAIQEFVADATKWVAGIDEMIVANDRLLASIAEVDAAAGSTGAAGAAAGAGATAAGAEAAAAGAAGATEAAAAADAAATSEAAAAARAAAAQDELAASGLKAAPAEEDLAAGERLAAEMAASLTAETQLLRDAQMASVDATLASARAQAVLRDAEVATAGATVAAGDAAGATAAKVDTSTGSMAAMGGKGKMAFLAVAAGAVYAVDKAAKFQTEVTRLYSAAGLTGASMQKVSQEILQVGTDTGFSGTQIAEALYHPVSAGLDLAASLAAVTEGAKLAKIHGANLDDTMYALSSIMKAFNINAGGAAKTAALLNSIVGQGDMRFQDFNQSVKNWAPTAASMGISIQSMGAGLAYLTDRGNSAEVASTRLTMGLSMVTAGSKAANVYLKDLGLTTGTLNLKNKSLQATMLAGGLTTNRIASDLKKPDGLYVALKDIQDSFHKAGLSASQADQVMSKIFGGGRSDKAMLSLMSNLDGVRQKYDSIGVGVNHYGSSWAQTQATVSFQTHKAMADLQNLAISFGQMLLPAVLKILTAFGKFMGFVEKHPLVAKLAGAILAIALAAGVLAGVMAGVSAIMDAFIPVLVIGAVVALAYGLYLLYTRCKTVRDIVHDVAAFFKAAWTDAMHAAGAAVNWFVNGPLAFIKQQIAAFSKWWQQNHTEIEQVTRVAWALISGYVKIYMAVIVAVLKTALTIIKSLWMTNWDLCRDIVKTVWNVMAALIRTALALIRDVIAVALAVITGHWRTAWRNLQQLTSDALRGMFSMIRAAFLGFVGAMFTLGVNLIMGLIRGMSSMAGNVIGMAKSIGSSAIGAIKSALGSLSPSKKAHHEGQMFAQGLVNGMDSYRGLVAVSASRLAQAMTAGAQAVRIPPLASVVTGGVSAASTAAASPTYGVSNQAQAMNLNLTMTWPAAGTLRRTDQKQTLRYSKRNPNGNGLTLQT
jgi:TP901 family phage tail tape measure protein